MATNAFYNREDEIKTIWRENASLYQIGIIVLVLLVGIAIGALLFNDNINFSLNIYTEIISILVTALVVDQIVRRRDQVQQRRRLLRDIAGPSGEVARAAINIMRQEGWLEGNRSLLVNANLWEAQLTGVSLNGANLQGAALGNAFLERAYLSNVNLSGADLMGADMRESDLVRTNLTNAQMRFANLTGAYLGAADLRGTNLQDCNLLNAHLTDMYFGNAQFNEETVLPDGTRWSSGADLSRFTEASHPDFWQPGWVIDHQNNSMSQ